MADALESLLLNALDYGITERDYWEMTPKEVIRAVNSKVKVRRKKKKKKATYDYILAQLITKGISITLGAKDGFPEIQEVYKGVFDDVIEEYEQKKMESKANVSAVRFKQFAQAFNNKFKNKVVADKNE